MTPVPKILSHEMWTIALDYLNDLSTIGKATRICKAWKEILEDNEFWKSFHLRKCIATLWIGEEPASWKTHIAAFNAFLKNFWKNKLPIPENTITCATQLYRNGYLNEALVLFSLNFSLTNPTAEMGRQRSLANIFLKLKMFEKGLAALGDAKDCKSQLLRGNIYLAQNSLHAASACYHLAQSQEITIDGHLGLMQVYKGVHEASYDLHRQCAFERIKTALDHARHWAIVDISNLECVMLAKLAYENEKSQKDLSAYLAAQSLETQLRNTVQNHIHLHELVAVKKYYEDSLMDNPFNIRVILAYVNFLEFADQVRMTHDERYNFENQKSTLETRLSWLVKCELLNPEIIETVYALGIVYGQLKKFEESCQKLLQAKNAGIKTEKLYIELLTMNLLLEPFRFYPADRLAKEALAAYPDSKEIQLLFCRIAMRHPIAGGALIDDRALEILAIAPGKKPAPAAEPDAENIAEPPLEDYPLEETFSSRELLLRAELLEKMKKYEAAEKSYRDAYELVPNEAATLQYLTILKYRQESERLSQLHAVHLGIMRCFVGRRKVPEGQNYVLTALPEYILPIAFSQAEELLIYSYEQQPSSAILMQLGHLYFSQYKKADSQEKKLRKADCIEMCSTALIADPKNLAAYLQLAQLYLITHEYEEAQKNITQVLNRDPQNLEGMMRFVELVDGMNATELFEVAIPMARAIVQQRKDATYFWMQLFEMHRVVGSVAKAKDDFVNIFVNDLSCTFSVSEKNITFGNLQDVILTGTNVFSLLLKQPTEFQESVCDAVLQKTDQCYPLQCLKGHLLFQRKEFKEAAECWKKALKLDPPEHDRHIFLNLLLPIYLSLEEPDQVCDIANQLIFHEGIRSDLREKSKLNSTRLIELGTQFATNFWMQNNVGVTLYFRGEYQQAISFLERAAAIEPSRQDKILELLKVPSPPLPARNPFDDLGIRFFLISPAWPQAHVPPSTIDWDALPKGNGQPLA